MAGPTPVPPPSQFVSGSTPTSGGASPTPAAGSTPKPNDRTGRQKDILGLSESQLQVALRMNLVTKAEVDAVKGAGYSDRIADDPWGKTENDIMAQWQKAPPAFFRSTLDSSESPTQALAGESSISGEPYGQGPTVSGAGGYTNGPTGTSAGGGASRTTGSGGGGSASSASAAPPPPTPLTSPWFKEQGAIGLPNNGGTIVMNGQQYRNPGTAQQGADGLWYNLQQDGQPGGVGFKSQTAANMARQWASSGPALTSRMGNSPAAKAAQQGGYSQTIPNEGAGRALFPTFSLDQQIAAGATKGLQGGEILGTLDRNNGLGPQDITYGGIGVGGGLTPVGNQMDPFASFTGQLPGNTSIGMSSILGNSGVNALYWLSQSTGIPESDLARMNLTPSQILQLDQAQSTLRQQGLMPDLASLRARFESSGYQGASGGDTLKWGGQNAQSTNTPYDQALAAYLGYADYKNPDLTYLPEPSGYGSTQIGNVAYGSNMFDEYYGG